MKHAVLLRLHKKSEDPSGLTVEEDLTVTFWFTVPDEVTNEDVRGALRRSCTDYGGDFKYDYSERRVSGADHEYELVYAESNPSLPGVIVRKATAIVQTARALLKSSEC